MIFLNDLITTWWQARLIVLDCNELQSVSSLCGKHYLQCCATCCKVLLTIMSVVHIRPARGQNCQVQTAILSSHTGAYNVSGPALIQTSSCQSCQAVLAAEETQPPQEVSGTVGSGVKDEVDVCCL